MSDAASLLRLYLHVLPVAIVADALLFYVTVRWWRRRGVRRHLAQTQRWKRAVLEKWDATHHEDGTPR